MNLKNYTSTVSVISSITKIENRLAQAGATHIAKSYDKERPVGMIFQIPMNGIPYTFKLPAKANRIYDYMMKNKQRSWMKSVQENTRLQADRTAWKILADSVDIQVSLILIDQVEPTEAFLSYLYDANHDQTLFEKMKENNFKQLNG